MASEVLVAEGIRKQYFRAGRQSGRTFDAVAPASLGLQAGELVVCMGRSGSGKSTLLNMLAGLLAPTEGKVLLDGQDLYALDDASLSRLRNQSIGVVPQGQTALHSLTVLQNVTLPSGLYGGGVDVEDRALDLLGQMEIADLADSYPAELSGGELRRMAIARSMIMRPRVLFADEPTSDLDDETTRLVLGMLREVADGGQTVFVVTHEPEAKAYASRVLRMDAGKLEGC
ncbi:MAG: ABC transporter ATP-binding protein [Atopobiaceae bacterium]|nr:ABC transporter ATP-binding protein [Atopobiaceae bacterium]